MYLCFLRMKVYSKMFYQLQKYYSSLIKNRENTQLWIVVQPECNQVSFYTGNSGKICFLKCCYTCDFIVYQYFHLNLFFLLEPEKWYYFPQKLDHSYCSRLNQNHELLQKLSISQNHRSQNGRGWKGPLRII